MRENKYIYFSLISITLIHIYYAKLGIFGFGAEFRHLTHAHQYHIRLLHALIADHFLTKARDCL